MEKGDWQASLAYRWLHSDRHFVGGREEARRQAEGSEVINDVHTFDVTATYAVNKRLSLNLTLPFVHATRSSLYEHDRTNRHTMTSGGLGDLRLVANYWLFNPDKYTNKNFGFGLGLKAPTGDDEDADIRYLYDRTNKVIVPTLSYVDNSIQPGDGGWGVLLEVQGFHKLFKNTFAYMNGTYLLNPQNTNDIGNSIWDAYVGRLGISYAVLPSQGIALSLGGRIEGVPPVDLIGESEGRRRPGFAISVEPGITWSYKKTTFNLTAPVALYRNRQRNAIGADGDAAFADFIILSSVAYRF